eukprot:CAMPEP_0185192916 /NCGR_PEP_ID=MMETSP1140-20130426/20202_1 /TAXON_ID=298111 /ORGANISM="Pavlova sp., Strain CCMP459" /LENGTH=275 /DNA_ID=CAMNT_0027759679 /DNA_START=9 /DNA_END=837 /DNA_ORIENTATION=+
MTAVVLATLSLALSRPSVAPLTGTPACMTLVRGTANRRLALKVSASAFAGVVLGGGPVIPAAHAKAVPTQSELSKLVEGYRGIVKLLDNWDDETITCDAFDRKKESCSTSAARRQAASSNMASCSCDFNPTRVQEVMGFKSTQHPLYLADQVMIRAQPLLKPDSDFDAYDTAVELWARKAEEANVMSYTSSWGEANPGGGRDAVQRYLDKSKKEVVESKELLRQILSALPVDFDREHHAQIMSMMIITHASKLASCSLRRQSARVARSHPQRNET